MTESTVCQIAFYCRLAKQLLPPPPPNPSTLPPMNWKNCFFKTVLEKNKFIQNILWEPSRWQSAVSDSSDGWIRGKSSLHHPHWSIPSMYKYVRTFWHFKQMINPYSYGSHSIWIFSKPKNALHKTFKISRWILLYIFYFYCTVHGVQFTVYIFGRSEFLVLIEKIKHL